MFFAKVPTSTSSKPTYRNVGSGLAQNGGITVNLASGECAKDTLLLFQGEQNRQPVAPQYEVLYERKDGSLVSIGKAKAQQNGHGLTCFFSGFTVRGGKRLFLRPVEAQPAQA